MNNSDVASDLIHGGITHLPHPAPRCGCAADDVIAYRDDDGDWTCTSCGRRARARATEPQAAAHRPMRVSVRRTRRAPRRPNRIPATFDSPLPTPWPS